GNRHSVGVAEHLDSVTAIRRPGIAQPADALLVVAERDRVLQGIRHIEYRRGGAGHIPVDQPDDPAAAPHPLPRPEVAVADPLPPPEPSPGPPPHPLPPAGGCPPPRWGPRAKTRPRPRGPGPDTFSPPPPAPDCPSIKGRPPPPPPLLSTRGAGKSAVSR